MAITRLVGANAITGTLPAANINDTSIGNITALPAGVGGKVIQVVQNYNANSGHIATTSTSFTASGIQATITPTASGNKIYVDFNTTIAQGSSGSQVNGQMHQKIGSGSFAAMSGASNIHIGTVVGLSSDTIYAGMRFHGSYTTTGTDNLIFEPYMKSSNGTSVRFVHSEGSYALTLTEVSA